MSKGEWRQWLTAQMASRQKVRGVAAAARCILRVGAVASSSSSAAGQTLQAGEFWLALVTA
eukprot:1574334-Alexandrium_andersonii.AAC.1